MVNANEKALDAALASIEKQFGKGSLMRLGDDAVVNVAAIPTGALSLDIALGIGGIPRGRVTEIYGPESSGKCLTADTHVWTDHGLETIEELFARVGQPASCASRVTDVSAQGVRMVNEEGELELLGGVTHNNRRAAWRVTLASGRHVDATANHPLRVLNDRGRVVWRKVGDLAVDDVLVSALFGADTAVGGDHLSEDEAVLLGYLIAEGTLGLSNRHAITFTNAYDQDVYDEYVGLLERVLDVDPSRVRTYADKDHKVHDTALRQRLADDYGLAFTGSAGKEIPSRVRTGGAKVQRAFLSALYEGDGWIEDGPAIGLTSASETLAQQVQLLLLGLGIPSTLSRRHNVELDRDHHTVLVTPGAVHRFLDIVGFRSARRADQVTTHLRDVVAVTQHEHIPHLATLLFDLRDAMGGDRELDAILGDLGRHDLASGSDGSIDCSPARLSAVLAWAADRHVPRSARGVVAALHDLAATPQTYERVVSVESIGEVPTFDVVLPQTHSFLANGVLSHNTTVALHVAAEAQKLGGIVAFIDAEHALDPVYARALGVDINELLVSQPDTGEQALEIADMLVRSGAVDLIIIDSVAALTPRAEIEGEMGQSHVGLQARLMSQALRKLAGSLSKSKTAMIFINQLREKIGVMFGCASWDTKVTLADGSTEFIGKIVNQRLPVEVMSYNVETGEFSPRPVVDWFDNGTTDEFLRFRVDAPTEKGGNGMRSFKLTPNHDVATPHGWVSAGLLSVGETVLQPADFLLSGEQMEVLLGSLMGDASLSPNRDGSTANFRWGHGLAQRDYADWKLEVFANVPGSSYETERAVFYDSRKLFELGSLREAVYIGGKKVLSWDYLKQLTPLSIAVWYQDDGSFQLRSKGVQKRTRGGSGRSEICVEALEASSRERLHELLRDTFGVGPTLVEKAGNAVFIFDTATTRRLHELVAEFVHPSMAYKLLPDLQHRATHVSIATVDPVQRPVAMEIREIDVVQAEPGRRHRYDIQVEGNHSYLVGGTVVHNSPETTPGGRALKFYSSVRLDVRRIESLKDGQEMVGNRVRVKVAKNKVAAPFRKAEFDIMYGEGISKEGSLIDIGVDEGFIRKAGAWYTYDGEQLGQGRENARTFLKEHGDIALEIEKRVLDKLGISPLAAEDKPDGDADADADVEAVADQDDGDEDDE